MKENDSLHKVNTEGLRRLKTDVLRLTISSSIIFSATGIFLVNIFKSNQINFILFIKFSYQYHSHTNIILIPTLLETIHAITSFLF